MSDKAVGTSGSFKWLNATQFFGALNDNQFKLFMTFALISLLGVEAEGSILSKANTFFVLPFLLFAAPAGWLADHVSKSRIITWAKAFEVLTMGVGLYLFSQGCYEGLYWILFAMSMQSAFFGPAKYGVIPELMERSALTRANSYISAFTYMAIIIGTVLAPSIDTWSDKNYTVAGMVCVSFAALGWFMSLGIARTPVASRAEKKPMEFVRVLRKDDELFTVILGSAYFLFLGAFMQLYLIPYGREVLEFSAPQSAKCFLFVAVGIGLGSLIAGRMSGRNVEFGLVPVGAAILSFASLGIALLPMSPLLFSTLLFVAGLGGGLYIVPLNAFIQWRSPREQLGGILACSSFLSWIGVLTAGALLHLFLEVFHWSARGGFLFIACLTVVLTIISLKRLPDFFARFVVLLLTRFCYRIKIRGVEHVPAEGGALLACNHISFVDALLLVATQQRRIRFLMSRVVYDNSRWWVRRLLKLAQVIPIHEGDPPREILSALASARKALKGGALVCVFPEGHISRNGMMMEFKPGFERILKGSGCPIIPVYIGGAWGSIASYAYGKQFSRRPVKFPYPVQVQFGEAMPVGTTAFELRQRILELSTDFFDQGKARRIPLEATFLKVARRNGSRKALSDTTGKHLNYREASVSAFVVAGRIKPELDASIYVGVLLPTSVGAALTNIALRLLDVVPVNMNFTASEEAFKSALTQCTMTTLITSRKFLETGIKVPLPERVFYLEDILVDISFAEKAGAFLRAKYMPSSWLPAARNFDPDAVATVLFSSGSTGIPKGVMLSHHNLLSNVESARTVFPLKAKDDFAGVLPLFHSFGLTFTLWLPLTSGFSVSYHPNPLDAAGLSRMIAEQGSTILFGTPTFLTMYLRRFKKEEVESLRIVLVGAEKLNAKLARKFEERFDALVLEGYGATELSPLATVSVPHREEDGMTQAGWKEGSVGVAMPGVSIKIVDMDSGETLPQGEEGLMLIKGPNVMLGYLGDLEKTKDALQEGWYNTGDIARLDEEGFVFITDRLSRFSKIGGEMVPHLRVEQELLKGKEPLLPCLVVTSLPDEKRGERLVVLFTEAAGSAEELQGIMQSSEVPNLWKPSSTAYVLVDEIPILGTGKLDLKGVKDLAGERGA